METIRDTLPPLVYRLKASEVLASRILEEIPIHVDAAALRTIIGSDGSSVHAVVKNWILDQVESSDTTHADLLDPQDEWVRRFRRKVLDSGPEAFS